MVLLMTIFANFMQHVAVYVLTPFNDTVSLKLVVVMVITPFIMNTFQLWVSDNFLRSKYGVAGGDNASDTADLTRNRGDSIGGINLEFDVEAEGEGNNDSPTFDENNRAVVPSAS